MAKIPTPDALGVVQPSAGRNVIAFDRQDRINLEAPGRAIEQAGRQVAQTGPQVFGAIKAAQDTEDDYEATKALIQFQREQERSLDEAKHNIQPGGDGFADSYRQQFDDSARSMFASLRDRGIRPAALQRADQKLLSWGEQFHKNAYHAELQERDRFHNEDVQKQLFGIENAVAENPDRVQDHIAAGKALIETSKLTLAKRAELNRRWPALMEQIAARTRIEKDPEGEIERLRLRPKSDADPVQSGGVLKAGEDGRIDPVTFARRMETKISESELNGTVPAWGPKFGITTGSPQEWARFFTMLQQQESGHRTARVNPDGSLQRFPTTPRGEQSYGPGQFKPGEYGLQTWADVNDPEKVADAYINVAKAGKIPAYFGSVQRPNEVLRHGKWFDETVGPKLAASGAVERESLDQPSKAEPKTQSGDEDPPVEFQSIEDKMAPYRHLPFMERQKLLNVARTAMRNTVATAVANDLKRIRDGLEPVAGPDGKTALDRAQSVMTKNQLAKINEQYNEARLEAEIVRPLRAMSEEQAAEHIAKYAPDGTTESDEYKRYATVVQKAEREWKRIADERKRDLALSIEKTPEVDAARREITAARQAAQSGRRFDPETGEPAPSLSPQQAQQKLVEARLAAQARIGIPSPERRIITRAEAAGLLPVDPKTMDEAQIDKTLRSASERAIAIYGSIHGPQAFKEAVAYKLGGGDKYKDVAAGALTRAMRGAPITPKDVMQLTQTDAADRIRFGEGADYFPGESPAISPLNNPASPQGGWRTPNLSTSWRGKAGPIGEWAAEAGKKPASNVSTPNDQQIQWLMTDPEKRQSAFDKMFGTGAAARYMGRGSPKQEP